MMGVVPAGSGVAVSRRGALAALAAAAAALGLEGWAALSANAPMFDSAELRANPTLLIATNRKPANGGRANPWFGPERAARTTFARGKLIPPDQGRFSLAAMGLDDWKL